MAVLMLGRRLLDVAFDGEQTTMGPHTDVTLLESPSLHLSTTAPPFEIVTHHAPGHLRQETSPQS